MRQTHNKERTIQIMIITITLSDHALKSYHPRMIPKIIVKVIGTKTITFLKHPLMKSMMAHPLRMPLQVDLK